MNPLIYKREFCERNNCTFKKVKLTVCDVSPITKNKNNEFMDKYDTWDLFIIDPKHDSETAKKIINDIVKTVRFHFIGKEPKTLRINAKLGEDYYNTPDQGTLYYDSGFKFFYDAEQLTDYVEGKL